MCSYIEQTRKNESNASCCWIKFSDFGSQLNPQILCNKENERNQKKTKKPKKTTGRKVWRDEVGVTEFRLRLGHAWVVSSRNCFAEVFFPHVISFLSTHHELLDHHPSRCSGQFFCHFFVCNLATCDEQSVELLLLSNLLHFLTFALVFDFVLCDVGLCVITQSHSDDVSCWSALMVPSLSRTVFRSFICKHCVVFLNRVYFPRFLLP